MPRGRTRVPEIRKGDTVLLLHGKDAGKQGVVERVVTNSAALSHVAPLSGGKSERSRRGFWKPEPAGEVVIREQHEVHIRLGASYPRLMPDLAWKAPIFHPNISTSGVVCLGGYGTYWVPSLSLDGMCEMLWDMVRYQNFDEKSPYNREAAAWATSQSSFPLPIDDRPIRDKLVKPVPASRSPVNQPAAALPTQFASPQPAARFRPTAPVRDVAFLGDVVEAEVVASVAAAQPDILFIE